MEYVKPAVFILALTLVIIGLILSLITKNTKILITFSKTGGGVILLYILVTKLLKLM